MSAPQPFGGHSSNRQDGPAGMRGLRIYDVPFNMDELDVDLERIRHLFDDLESKKDQQFFQ